MLWIFDWAHQADTYSLVDGQSGLLWLHNVQANISETLVLTYVRIYIVRIRIKIIHARHTRFFLSLFVSSQPGARFHLSIRLERGKTANVLYTQYTFILPRENIWYTSVRPSILCVCSVLCCAVYGPLCPILLCQAVFHLQACSYTYKCSNNSNNNLSLVQHFQTSSIHRQESHSQNGCGHFGCVIPNFSEQSILFHP